MTRKFTLAIAAIGTAGIAGTAVVSALPGSSSLISLLAATPSPTANQPKNGARAQVCQDFLQHFSADLGVSPDKTQGAFRQAAGETLQDAVNKGKITKAQADKIKARIANRQLCSGFRLGRDRKPLQAWRQTLLNDAAKALGVSSAELQQDLKNGKSLQDVANDKKVSESQFRSNLAKYLKADLDKEVSAGHLTAAQEQKLLDRVQKGPIPLWQRPHKAGSA